MKKSNKIFFVFLVVLPLMMGVYNLLLQSQYAKGNLVQRIHKVRNIDRPLKPFKHLVFNGKAAIFDSYGNPYINEVKRFALEVGAQHQPHLTLNETLGDFVKERYSGDTLYISFEVERLRNREDLMSYDSRQMKVFAPALASLSIKKAKMEIIGVNQATPLKVSVDESYSVVFADVQLPAMAVSAEKSYITFASGIKVDSLWYEGNGASMFYFNIPNGIGKVVNGGDSTAVVSIIGKSAGMLPYLNKQ